MLFSILVDKTDHVGDIVFTNVWQEVKNDITKDVPKWQELEGGQRFFRKIFKVFYKLREFSKNVSKIFKNFLKNFWKSSDSENKIFEE